MRKNYNVKQRQVWHAIHQRMTPPPPPSWQDLYDDLLPFAHLLGVSENELHQIVQDYQHDQNLLRVNSLRSGVAAG